MTKVFVWLIGIVIVLGAAYVWLTHSSAPAVDTSGTVPSIDMSSSTPSAASTTTNTTSSSGTGAPMTATVTYDGNSFSPSTVTVRAGGTVSFTDTSGTMWIASDPHPVHNGYDGTTRQQHCASGYTGAAPFDECSAGSSFSFTFKKIGSWGYHDHLNSGARGTIVVQ